MADKGTDLMKAKIKAYLDSFAEGDASFAERYANPAKNIDECIDFIIDQVRKSGRCGFADEEVYGIAVHYYDEDVTDITKHQCKVVINEEVQLTPEEIAEAKERAIQRVINEEANRIRRPKKSPVSEPVTGQQSLFKTDSRPAEQPKEATLFDLMGI